MKLADLRKEAALLGLGVPDSKDRAPYLEALRDHFLERDFPSGSPYSELHPMQCFDFWNLSPKAQSKLWKDPNWLAQEKLNGMRLIIHFRKGLGVFAHSRVVSVHTYRRSELTDRLPFKSFIPEFDATIDTEMMNPFKVHVLDITSWDGIDLRLRKLTERLSFLPDLKAAIAPIDEHFSFPPVYFLGKKEVYERILAAGGEGIVFKNVNYHYEDSNSRSRWGWVKLKRQIELTSYVSGYEQGKTGSEWEGYVSCLIFSVNTDAGHQVIAKVSSLPWQFRKDISLRDKHAGTAKLNMDVYGKVALVSGLELSRNARRLVHARIVHWRSDLCQDDCLYSFNDLEAARKGELVIPLRVQKSPHLGYPIDKLNDA